MSTQSSDALRQAPPSQGYERERYPVSEQGGGFGLSVPALLLTGVVVVGLGYLAWQYVGPDLVRYMKIRNM